MSENGEGEICWEPQVGGSRPINNNNQHANRANLPTTVTNLHHATAAFDAAFGLSVLLDAAIHVHSTLQNTSRVLHRQ